MSVPLVKSWLKAFLEDHQAAFPGARWPMDRSDSARQLWSAWLHAFIAARVTEAEARAASATLDQPDLWCYEHPQIIVAIVEAARSQAEALAARPKAATPTTPQGCGRCGGSGVVTVFHPRYTGSVVIAVDVAGPGGEVRKAQQPGRVAAHCVCPMGRWVRSKLDVETSRRMPDLGDVLEGKSRWLAEDPSVAEVIEFPEGVAGYRGAWRELAARLCEGGIVPVGEGRAGR